MQIQRDNLGRIILTDAQGYKIRLSDTAWREVVMYGYATLTT